MIGVLIFPWKLLSDPTGYIYIWLIAYSALLGPIGGIMIVNYFVLRRLRLFVERALFPRRPVLVYRGLPFFRYRCPVVRNRPQRTWLSHDYQSH